MSEDKRKRYTLYLQPQDAARFDELIGEKDRRNVAADLLADLLRRDLKTREGGAVYVDLYDAELRRQFEAVAGANDMSREDALRKLVRKEYFALIDKGDNQRNIIRHIYVLVRIGVYLIMAMATKQGIEFAPTPDEQLALRNQLPVLLDREKSLGGGGK